MHQTQLISKIPHILKEMYDADLLEEEVILSWAEKVCIKKKIIEIMSKLCKLVLLFEMWTRPLLCGAVRITLNFCISGVFSSLGRKLIF